MIKQWFASTSKKTTTPRQQQHQGGHVHQLTHYNEDIQKAQKEGISVQEYRARQAIVKAEVVKFNQAGLSIHMTVRPVDEKAYEEAGECVIMGLCTDYDTYGAVRWNDPPLVMQVRSKKHDGYINCSIGWVKKLESVQC